MKGLKNTKVMQIASFYKREGKPPSYSSEDKAVKKLGQKWNMLFCRSTSQKAEYTYLQKEAPELYQLILDNDVKKLRQEAVAAELTTQTTASAAPYMGVIFSLWKNCRSERTLRLVSSTV